MRGRGIMACAAIAVPVLVAGCRAPDQTAVPPSGAETDGTTASETAAGEAGPRLTHAAADGTISGRLSDLRDSRDWVSAAVDGAQSSVVTLTQEPAPTSAWALLTVGGTTATSPGSSGRVPAATQQVLLTSAADSTDVSVTGRGAFAQWESDGGPDTTWIVSVQPADVPARQDVLGCWAYQRRELSFDGGSSWLPEFGGLLSLHADGTFWTSDELQGGRDGRWDLDSRGRLQLDDQTGTAAYDVTTLDGGTPPTGGQATMLMRTIEAPAPVEVTHRTAVRLADSCGEGNPPPTPDGLRYPDDTTDLFALIRGREVPLDGTSDACQPATVEVADDATHLDPATAQPAEVLYDQLPATSGPHLPAPSPPVTDLGASVDVRSAVHNLEHGAVVVWVDPSQEDADRVQVWARTLAMFGFEHPTAGGGVFAVPLPETNTFSAPLVFTAWGHVLTCDRFDADAADRFVAEHYGTNGQAPEGVLSPYPSDGLVSGY